MLEWNAFGRGFDSRRLHHFLKRTGSGVGKDMWGGSFSFAGKNLPASLFSVSYLPKKQIKIQDDKVFIVFFLCIQS